MLSSGHAHALAASTLRRRSQPKAQCGSSPLHARTLTFPGAPCTPRSPTHLQSTPQLPCSLIVRSLASRSALRSPLQSAGMPSHLCRRRPTQPRALQAMHPSAVHLPKPIFATHTRAHLHAKARLPRPHGRHGKVETHSSSPRQWRNSGRSLRGEVSEEKPDSSVALVALGKMRRDEALCCPQSSAAVLGSVGRIEKALEKAPPCAPIMR